MPSSAIIRVQQQQQKQTAIINQTNHSNFNSEKHTISMFRLILRAFDYLYLFVIKICSYFLLLLKRLLKILVGTWTFLFVTARVSKKKVKHKKKKTLCINSIFIFS